MFNKSVKFQTCFCSLYQYVVISVQSSFGTRRNTEVFWKSKVESFKNTDAIFYLPLVASSQAPTYSKQSQIARPSDGTKTLYF